MIKLTGTCVLLTIILFFGCSPAYAPKESEVRYICPRSGKSPEWHAIRLLHGDFRYGREGEWTIFTAFGEPYHLSCLIQEGETSVPLLLDLLYDETPTPFEYQGWFSFRGGKIPLEEGGKEPQLRNATIGDLADYALRQLYRADVGYKSYLPEEERDNAIEQWKHIAQTKKVHVRTITIGKRKPFPETTPAPMTATDSTND